MLVNRNWPTSNERWCIFAISEEENCEFFGLNISAAVIIQRNNRVHKVHDVLVQHLRGRRGVFGLLRIGQISGKPKLGKPKFRILIQYGKHGIPSYCQSLRAIETFASEARSCRYLSKRDLKLSKLFRVQYGKIDIKTNCLPYIRATDETTTNKQWYTIKLGNAKSNHCLPKHARKVRKYILYGLCCAIVFISFANYLQEICWPSY